MRAVFAPFVFLVACANHAAICYDPKPSTLTYATPVWIDARFSDEAKGEIEDAIARWNVVLGGYRRFFIASDEIDRPHDWLTISGPFSWGVSVTAFVISPAGTSEDVLADTRAQAEVRFYLDHFTSEPIESIALHEFGHVLGLPDDPPGSRLMTAHYQRGQACVDAATVAALGMLHPSWRPYLRPESCGD